MKKTYSILAFLSIFLMLQASLFSTAMDDRNGVHHGLDQNNDHEFVVGNFTLKTPSGQVPFYFFWDNTNPDATYRVQFSQLFEVDDADGDSTYDRGDENRISGSSMSLSSLDWTFSEVINDTNSNEEVVGIHFNITGIEKGGADDAFFIQFRNHIDVVNDENEVKFDIVIDNYDWTSETSILVMRYKIQSTHPNYSGETNQNGNSVTFGDGYLESEDTASDGNGTINSGLSTGSEEGENDPFVYVSYEHFEGEMVHDPTVGIQTSSVDSDDELLGSSELVFLGTLALIIPAVLRKFR